MNAWTRRAWLSAPLVLAPRALRAKETVLRVASFGVTPYLMEGGADHPVQGALVEFFDQEIAPRMGVRWHWLPVMTVPRVLRSLEDGTADFCPILTRSPERERILRFSTSSSIRFDSVVALRPDHPLASRAKLTAADLDGCRVGWIQGSPLPAGLERPGIRWEWVSVLNWERAILAQVERGRIDAAYFSNRATPTWHAKAGAHALVMVPLDVPSRPLFAATPLTQPPALMERYEQAARDAFAGNRFDAVLLRWQERAA